LCPPGLRGRSALTRHPPASRPRAGASGAALHPTTFRTGDTIMSLTTDGPTISEVGDALTAGIQRDLRRRRHPVRRVSVALAILVIIGTGTAAAAGVFSTRQVAAGMPAGAVLFAGTHPSCTADGDAFACMLQNAPTGDEARDKTDFTGTKEVLV